MKAGTAFGVESGTDVVLSFENATGGSGNDIIVGTDWNNELIGNGGNDWLTGGAGLDSLVRVAVEATLCSAVLASTRHRMRPPLQGLWST